MLLKLFQLASKRAVVASLSFRAHRSRYRLVVASLSFRVHRSRYRFTPPPVVTRYACNSLATREYDTSFDAECARG